MGCTRIPLASLPFVQGNHPLERKKAGTDAPVALLEFGVGFSDPHWCRRSHVIYVLRGVLTLELEGAHEVIAEGEGCVVDAGTAHRARNAGSDLVLAFVASDLEPVRR